jgi:hypothetical protein
MAFDITDLKEAGRVGNSQEGGQLYILKSSADTLATMMASGYMNEVAYKLNVRDIVLMSGSDLSQLVRVATNAAGVVTVTTAQGGGEAQSIVGPGEANVTQLITEVESESTDAITLPDGALGQMKIISLIIDGGTMTLTPATRLGYATITFADAGDSVTLMFLTGGWAVIGQGGLSTGPVVA